MRFLYLPFLSMFMPACALLMLLDISIRDHNSTLSRFYCGDVKFVFRLLYRTITPGDESIYMLFVTNFSLYRFAN